MQAGTNTFPVLVTDVSGGPITGLTVADFDFDGQVGSTVLNTPTIAESSTGEGYYLASVDIPVGQGFLSIEAVDAANKFVTPTFYTIDATIYDADDVYASIARQSLDITQVAVSSYETQQIGPYKQGDTVDITYVVPDSIAMDISGYTDFKASLWDDTILTSISGSAGYVGDFTLTVDVGTKSVRMVLPYTLTQYLVADGLTEQYYYSDLQAVTPSGYHKTLAELSILFRRQFTR